MCYRVVQIHEILIQRFVHCRSFLYTKKVALYQILGPNSRFQSTSLRQRNSRLALSSWCTYWRQGTPSGRNVMIFTVFQEWSCTVSISFCELTHILIWNQAICSRPEMTSQVTQCKTLYTGCVSVALARRWDYITAQRTASKLTNMYKKLLSNEKEWVS